MNGETEEPRINITNVNDLTGLGRDRYVVSCSTRTASNLRGVVLTSQVCGYPPNTVIGIGGDGVDKDFFSPQ